MKSGNTLFKFLAVALALTLAASLILYRHLQGARSPVTPESAAGTTHNPAGPPTGNSLPQTQTTQPQDPAHWAGSKSDILLSPTDIAPPAATPPTNPSYFGGSKVGIILTPKDAKPRVTTQPTTKPATQPATQPAPPQSFRGLKSAPVFDKSDPFIWQGTVPSTQPGAMHPDTAKPLFGLTSADF